MSDELIAEVRRLSEAATAGPWEPYRCSSSYEKGACGISHNNDISYCNLVVADTDREECTHSAITEEDADLIARYRTLAPQLADRLEAAERRLAELVKAATAARDAILDSDLMGGFIVVALDKALAAAPEPTR